MDRKEDLKMVLEGTGDHCLATVRLMGEYTMINALCTLTWGHEGKHYDEIFGLEWMQH